MDDYFQAPPSQLRQIALYSLVILAVIALCGWFYGAPYLALNNIRAAAEAGDAETLSELVDFPSLRESLKDTFKATFTREISKPEGKSFVAALGLMMARVIIDPMVEATVTPTSIAAFMQGNQPAVVTKSYLYKKLARTPTAKTGELNTDNWDNARMGYEGLSKFVVRFKDTKTGNDAIIVVLRRTGLSWQLSAIRLPVLLESGSRAEYKRQE